MEFQILSESRDVHPNLTKPVSRFQYCDQILKVLPNIARQLQEIDPKLAQN